MSKNKYLTIKPSVVYTDEVGNAYPDIFTFPIESFIMLESPLQYVLSINDIYRFDFLIASYYGTSDYDDIVLWLNNIEYVSQLTAGTIIFLPAKKDIDNYYRDNLT